MSEALDKLRAHFREKVDGGLRCVDVPELDLSIYYGPETVEQRDYYFADLAEQKHSGFCKLLIARAKSEGGKRLFSKADLVHFEKSVDPDLVVKIANQILSDDTLDADDAGK